MVVADIQVDETGHPTVRIIDPLSDNPEPADENGNPVDKRPELQEGQRVRVLDSEPPAYGHILELCDCPFASALKSRCVTLDLHESCGGGTAHQKEYNLEAID